MNECKRFVWRFYKKLKKKNHISSKGSQTMHVHSLPTLTIKLPHIGHLGIPISVIKYVLKVIVFKDYSWLVQ